MVAIFCIDVCGFWFGINFVVFVFYSKMNVSFMQQKQMVNEQCREGKQSLQNKLFYELSRNHVQKE